MKFKQFLVDAAMNPGVFRDVEKRMGDIARVGFEFEFAVNEGSNFFQFLDFDESSDYDYLEKDEEDLNDQRTEMVKDETQFSVSTNIAKYLSKLLHAEVRVHMEPGETDKQPGIWYIEPDSSINGDYGLELVSPPLPLSDALKVLPKVCKFISDNKFETNGSTGFHINVSIPNIARTLDRTKLILFMGEKHAAQIFKREASTFAVPQIDAILKSVQTNGRIPRSFDNMMLTATKGIKMSKYTSVNFLNLSNGGYLEFRIAGGADYHKRTGELEETILRFARAVEIACEPDEERQNYAKKLAKLFNRAQSEILGNTRASDLFARFGELHRSPFSAPHQFHLLRQRFKIGANSVLKHNIILFIDDLFIEEDDKNISLSALETGILRKLVNDAKIQTSEVSAVYALMFKTEHAENAEFRRSRFKRIFKI